MATDKLYNVCGISKLGGEYKVRFANDVLRIKVLAKHGHQDIRLAELDTAMSKVDAVKAIAKMSEFEDVTAQAAIADYLDRKDDKPAKAVSAKVKAPAKTLPVKTPAKAPAKAKAASTSDLEDAPF